MAELTSYVTRAAEMYVDRLWMNGIESVVDSIFPGLKGSGTVVHILLYAVLLTIFIVGLKRLLDLAVVYLDRNKDPANT